MVTTRTGQHCGTRHSNIKYEHFKQYETKDGRGPITNFFLSKRDHRFTTPSHMVFTICEKSKLQTDEMY